MVIYFKPHLISYNKHLNTISLHILAGYLMLDKRLALNFHILELQIKLLILSLKITNMVTFYFVH